MRKSAYMLAPAMLLVIGAARGQEGVGRWASPDDPTARAIVAVERAWAETSCGKSPPPMLRAAVANDFQGTHTQGQRYDKSQALEPGNDRNCLLGPVRIRLFGDSLAIAYGHESNVSKNQGGTETKHCDVWTDTWLKRDGTWQIIASQDNALACR